MKSELEIALRGMGRYTRKPEIVRQLARSRTRAAIRSKLRRMYGLVLNLYQ